MAIPTLIYCGDGNKRFAEIAIDAGFKYGARLPSSIYYPIYFADQDWKNPNRSSYMKALDKHRPYIASVIDWGKEDQLSDVLDWASEAAEFVEVVMIIPKVQGGIKELPKSINGKPIRLGYSVPTKYGGTELLIQEFLGWPVHLLGGSPQKQKELSYYMDVVSIDGNMSHKMAIKFGAFFDPKRKTFRGYWPMIKDIDGKSWGNDGIYEAFRRSCGNIIEFWARDYNRINRLAA